MISNPASVHNVVNSSIPQTEPQSSALGEHTSGEIVRSCSICAHVESLSYLCTLPRASDHGDVLILMTDLLEAQHWHVKHRVIAYT